MSERELEARGNLTEARNDAGRVLRDLAHEANAAGHRALGTEALELDQSLQRDAAKTCSLGALKKLDIRRPRRSASRHERPWRSAWASPAAT